MLGSLFSYLCNVINNKHVIKAKRVDSSFTENALNPLLSMAGRLQFDPQTGRTSKHHNTLCYRFA